MASLCCWWAYLTLWCIAPWVQPQWGERLVLALNPNRVLVVYLLVVGHIERTSLYRAPP